MVMTDSILKNSIFGRSIRLYFFGLLALAVGVSLHTRCNIDPLLSTLGCGVCNIWQLKLPQYGKGKKFWILMVVWMFAGAAICPPLDLVIEIDRSFLFNAFVATAVAFLWFSTVALLATSTNDLYLWGLLYSAVFILLRLDYMSSTFGGFVAVYKYPMYVGLLLVVRSIIVRTPRTIEKAHLGDFDYLKHALQFFD